MYLKNIQLLNFKNYSETQLTFESQLNCLVGENGAGKTNILDAIHYLSMSRSFLNTSDRQNIRFDQPFFSIKGVFQKNDKEYTIHCAVKIGEKKTLHQNRKAYDKLADHIGLFPSVVVSPYDKDLITEGSEWRRKWIDSTISQADRTYLNNLQRYTRILTQRNALLKAMNKTNSFDYEPIEIWDTQLSAIGTQIYQIRKKNIDEFTPLFQKYYTRIAQAGDQVSIEYYSQLTNDSFEKLLIDNKYKDFVAQYTTIGIHKDDFIFSINNRPIKKFGSQGQQKSFLLAIRLAQYEWLHKKLSVRPILLLDDIFDKLDPFRVHRLIEIVNSPSFGQVIITDTDIERIERTFQSNKIQATIYQIAKGQANIRSTKTQNISV